MLEITVEIQTMSRYRVTHLHVAAEVRYWEDARVNGAEDNVGDLVPCRSGKLWRPVICLATGAVIGWPEGVKADIHYKVCDQGEYWLVGPDGTLDWRGDYVPDDLLAVGDTGFGDYIILKIGADGKIEGWKPPELDGADWKLRDSP